MRPNQPKKQKRPVASERPFPWKCRHCGKQEVVMATTDHEARVRHDGRLHVFTIANLQLPICGSCDEKVFTEKVDRQVSAALRSHLNLLAPDQIRQAIKRVNMPQKEIAQRSGIAEATLSRWLNETQIQSRSMDNLLRVFFGFPQVRSALCGASQDPQLGLSDVAVGALPQPTGDPGDGQHCPASKGTWPEG